MAKSNVYLESFVSELNARYGFSDQKLSYAGWVTKHTTLKGAPYSFYDHEFQEEIINDTRQQIVVKKCAQVGLSEVMVRGVLAFIARQQGLTAILTQPSRKNALDFSTTRVDDVIKDSRLLYSMIDSSVDSKELKKIGKSYLYIKGTIGAKAAISVPADMLIHDELDFSDLEIINKYSSRIQHSKYKLFRKFSTPTIPNFGISKEFNVSDQKYYMKKCPHCGKWNKTDNSFFEDVIVKGYNGELKNITLDMLAYIKPDDVQYLCQGCRKPITYHDYTAREWVPMYEGKAISGYQVTPFDTPFQDPYNLLKQMNTYTRYADFVNFALGKDYVDTDSIFDLERVEFFTDDIGHDMGLCMGIDFGKTCWVTVGCVNPDESITIVYKSAVNEHELISKVQSLQKEFFIGALVCDALPQTKLSRDVCSAFDGLALTCYYSDSQKDLYSIKSNEEDVTVNRTQIFDIVLHTPVLRVKSCSQDQTLKKHLLGMVKQRDIDDEHIFRYVKVDEDHFLHSLGYMRLACHIQAEQGLHLAPITVDTSEIQHG